MARPLRIQYPDACYHLMSRGDRREEIFRDLADREQFLELLGKACGKTGWQVHAYCLMSNHWHAVVETPQPNLALGMRWLLGTYTQRFNRRHRQWGHLFGGRYKAQLIDAGRRGYLLAACNYVHLNPKRAGLIGPEAPLESYRWSSYPAYLKIGLRPEWLRTDRLLGEHGLRSDTARTRREFSRRMEGMSPIDFAGENEPLRRGWKLGAEDFGDRLVDKLTLTQKRGVGEPPRDRREIDEALAERLIGEGLAAVGWSAQDLRANPKGDRIKVEIAQQVRAQTPMTRGWIARRLQMGSPGYLSQLLARYDDLKL